MLTVPVRILPLKSKILFVRRVRCNLLLRCNRLFISRKNPIRVNLLTRRSEERRVGKEKYITEHTPEQTVSIALKTHRPVIEGEKIVLLVDNQIQLEKVEAIRMHLQNMLMKNLKNGYVTFEFKLFDSNTTQEEKKLFTASEKFEHFMKLNPVVADLKNIFGLELE